jgi:primosomal protein N' (replication factor Y)
MIHFPDFRSIERTYQMVTQVSGRAGRRETPGKVILQTGNPDQPIIKLILEQDYLNFYKMEMRERDDYRYPPFVRMIKILVRSKDRQLTGNAADEMSNILKEDLGASRILGPQEPVINKIRDKYLMEIFLKVERKYKIEAVKDIIQSAYLEILKAKTYSSVEFIYDVDPY